jgi:hypothetical protein
MNTSTIIGRSGTGAGQTAGARGDTYSDFDLAEVRGLSDKATGVEEIDTDWLYIATADPAFLIKDAD